MSKQHGTHVFYIIKYYITLFMKKDAKKHKHVWLFWKWTLFGNRIFLCETCGKMKEVKPIKN